MPPKTEKSTAKKTAAKGSWAWCIKEAYKNLKIEGFQPVKKGSDLYTEVKRLQELHQKKP
jgi:hypothetical protein